jgi:ribosomal protein S12 methylthiotransferase
MQTQQEVSARLLKAKVAKTLPVIIDEPGATVATGRTKYDAPDIDGVVYVASHRTLKTGEIVDVRIDRSDEYDLHGTAV